MNIQLKKHATAQTSITMRFFLSKKKNLNFKIFKNLKCIKLIKNAKIKKFEQTRETLKTA